MDKPLVSICCITYNHAPFIRKCLDGFLMQETNFRIEILIHDDASTDGTDGIIREYAEKNPDLFFPLFETENQYSHGHQNDIDFFNYNRAKGKYIAYCEGDDYWTDPYKLQKQVDFMETHPDYSVCFHRCKHLDYTDNLFTDDAAGDLFQNGEEGVDISLELFFRKWVTQPLTMLFRKSSFNPRWECQYEMYRDTHEIYHLLRNGKGYLFNFFGGVRVRHQGGLSSSNPLKKQMQVEYSLIKDLYSKNKSDDCIKDYLVRIIKFILSRRDIDWDFDRLALSMEYLSLTKDFYFILKKSVPRVKLPLMFFGF